MAIEPVNRVTMRPDITAPRRPDFRLQEMMQTGRETSALLSTLPGPNLSFFRPAAPLQGISPSGAEGGGVSAPRRLNAPLLETEQQGRVAAALLSPLMGQNERTFQAPTPPSFVRGANEGQAASAVGGGAPLLPRAGAQLLETEQSGRTTSALLSGLMGPGQTGGVLSQPNAGAGSGSALSAMRAAEGVIEAVETTSPTPLNTRIANDAYQMEMQAQRQHTSNAVGPSEKNWEWFA